MVLPLLAKLQCSKTDWTILLEVAWSLGKIPDKRSIQLLYDLDKKFQAIREPDNSNQCADSIPGRNRALDKSLGQKGSSLAH